MNRVPLDQTRLVAARRQFLISAGLAGLGAMMMPSFASAQAANNNGLRRRRSRRRDRDILNFALNLEYLEAEFYMRAAYGVGLAESLTTGTGTRGEVTGGSQVPFTTLAIRHYAEEIAADEEAHVRFIRTALGNQAVARPAIDIGPAFTAAAIAAGLITTGQTFDPYANEDNFLLAAYIFEDVGVTAYKGAAPLLLDPDVLEAAAGILAVEAYHAGNIRTVLVQRNLVAAANAISNLRDTVDGTDDRDQGVTGPLPPIESTANESSDPTHSNIIPTDTNGIAFSRTPGQVLNIVYLGTPNQGGFFPAGVNGVIR